MPRHHVIVGDEEHRVDDALWILDSEKEARTLGYLLRALEQVDGRGHQRCRLDGHLPERRRWKAAGQREVIQERYTPKSHPSQHTFDRVIASFDVFPS